MEGQRDPEVEHRLLLAILLSMAVLFATPYVYQYLYPPPPVPDSEPPPVETTAPPPPALQPPPETEPQAVPETEGIAEKIEVENEDLRLRFSTVGGVLESVQLKEYRNEQGDPLQLLPQGLPDDLPKLLQIRSGDEFVDQRLGGVAFEWNGESQPSEDKPARLEFTYAAGGVEARKVVEIPFRGYEFSVETELRRLGVDAPHQVLLGSGIGNLSEVASGDFLYPAVAYHSAGTATHYYEDDIENGRQQLSQAAHWIGVDSKYFTYVLVAPEAIRGIGLGRDVWNRPPEQEGGSSEEVVLLNARADFAGAAKFILYTGPKDRELLHQTDPTLGAIIDYGWLALLIQPLVLGLKFIYENVVENYGWAIILLTFIINLALFPMRYKQMASMKKMSALQPKMKSIQDRYKRMKRDDPRRKQMNTEIMALYKEHGVNPLGGCLPLLLQMPILIAFYRMLDAVIELRGAPFMLWIQDLSKPDPYYVTPIVMGATMVAQQKMTPSSADPAQKRMMMLLPIVFTFLFLGFSSGLVIYFLFSNVFAMMLQVLVQRWKPETESAKTPKKTAKKRNKTT